MELPKGKIKPELRNPKWMVVFGFQKSGKTTALAELDDNLLIDLEDGSDYVEAMKVKVNNLKEFSDLIRALDAQKKKYKFGTVDTGTKLEDIAWELAYINYKKSPMGRQYSGDVKDLINLPKGLGYGLHRQAYLDLLDWLKPYFETLILVCHVKISSFNKDGEEIEMIDLNLTGQLKTIIGARADAVGVFYRKKNKSFLSFKGGESFIVEGRLPHLRGKEFVIIESDDKGVLNINWDEVFPKS